MLRAPCSLLFDPLSSLFSLLSSRSGSNPVKPGQIKLR
jgi:hypothetical protein